MKRRRFLATLLTAIAALPFIEAAPLIAEEATIAESKGYELTATGGWLEVDYEVAPMFIWVWDEGRRQVVKGF